MTKKQQIDLDVEVFPIIRRATWEDGAAILPRDITATQKRRVDDYLRSLGAVRNTKLKAMALPTAAVEHSLKYSVSEQDFKTRCERRSHAYRDPVVRGHVVNDMLRGAALHKATRVMIYEEAGDLLTQRVMATCDKHNVQYVVADKNFGTQIKAEYDHVFVYPSFDDDQDMQRTREGAMYLTNGGTLDAVFTASCFTGTHPNAIAFREWMQSRVDACALQFYSVTTLQHERLSDLLFTLRYTKPVPPLPSAFDYRPKR